MKTDADDLARSKDHMRRLSAPSYDTMTKAANAADVSQLGEVSVDHLQANNPSFGAEGNNSSLN